VLWCEPLQTASTAYSVDALLIHIYMLILAPKLFLHSVTSLENGRKRVGGATLLATSHIFLLLQQRASRLTG